MRAEASPLPADDPDAVDLATSSQEILDALVRARSAMLALVGTCRRALPLDEDGRALDPEGQSALDRQLGAALDAMVGAATCAHPKAIVRRTGHSARVTSAARRGEVP